MFWGVQPVLAGPQNIGGSPIIEDAWIEATDPPKSTTRASALTPKSTWFVALLPPAEFINAARKRQRRQPNTTVSYPDPISFFCGWGIFRLFPRDCNGNRQAGGRTSPQNFPKGFCNGPPQNNSCRPSRLGIKSQQIQSKSHADCRIKNVLKRCGQLQGPKDGSNRKRNSRFQFGKKEQGFVCFGQHVLGLHLRIRFQHSRIIVEPDCQKRIHCGYVVKITGPAFVENQIAG